MIRSVYSSQDELMRAVSTLYVGDRFDCDPTYNRGFIHKALQPPIHRSDINGEKFGIQSIDCRELSTHIGERSQRSIMFDPPFLAGGGTSGVMNETYSSYRSISDLYDFYRESMLDFFLCLKKHGYLVFKCQDLLNGRVQNMSHCEVYNMAMDIGFYARDLFILVSNKRMRPYGMATQIHSRKFHSYFWVFQKCSKRNGRHTS